MAEMCSAVKISVLGGQILRCDLPRHEIALGMHYDKLEDTEWRTGHQPSAVPYTPTGPLKKLEESLA